MPRARELARRSAGTVLVADLLAARPFAVINFHEVIDMPLSYSTATTASTPSFVASSRGLAFAAPMVGAGV